MNQNALIVKRICLTTLASLFLFCSSHCLAQPATGSAAMQEAQAYFNQQDWPNAAKAFKKITENQPQNGQAWLFYGSSLHNQERFAEAISAFEKADKLGFAAPRVRFNLARSNARLGKTDESFAWLEKATQAGFGQVQLLKSDQDLKSLRDNERFHEIVKLTDKNARPCEYNTDCRAFDFWIGEWEVFTPTGQKAGENIIEKTTNGCMLLENWTSATGGTGKSVNYFDAAAKKWKQLWIDGTGGHMSYEGGFSKGAMRFEGYQIQGNGQKSLFKMTFTPQENGDVRQYFEQSLDNGKTWNVWFDGIYKKK